MLGWLAAPGPPYGGYDFVGFYKLASLDTSQTANWWMKNGGKDAAAPSDQTPESGCAGNLATPSSNSNWSDLAKIPSKDMYGNSLAGTNYTNSQIVGGGSLTSIYNGTALDPSQVTDSYHWGLAMWNSVDNTALNIRSDSNLANRTGDTQNMATAIYAIGYTGNSGTDQGLLKRVTNDPTCSCYTSVQPQGIYASASNPAQLASAFNAIATAVLRLSK
jgi:hypothetical protein